MSMLFNKISLTTALNSNNLCLHNNTHILKDTLHYFIAQLVYDFLSVGAFVWFKVDLTLWNPDNKSNLKAEDEVECTCCSTKIKVNACICSPPFIWTWVCFFCFFCEVKHLWSNKSKKRTMRRKSKAWEAGKESGWEPTEWNPIELNVIWPKCAQPSAALQSY